MSLNTLEIKQKIKYSENTYYKLIRTLYFGLKRVQIPNIFVINFLYRTIFRLYSFVKNCFFSIWHFLIIKPTFQSFCREVGHSLFIESKLPQIWNNPDIYIGNNVTLSGHTSFFACPFTKSSALTIGNNSYIGYSTTVAIGNKVNIGDNVKIAAGCFIAGYYGHPSDSQERIQNLPEKNIGEINIKDNVWIGTNSKIMKNVTIGKNSIISAGSVVIKDVPDNVIVAGNPAKIVKKLGD